MLFESDLSGDRGEGPEICFRKLNDIGRSLSRIQVIENYSRSPIVNIPTHEICLARLGLCLAVRMSVKVSRCQTRG